MALPAQDPRVTAARDLNAVAAPIGGPLEIACDESGSEGLKLIGGSTDVFAHASVSLDLASAEACISRVRVDARSPANEVKASVVLRERNRRVLEWLLGASGPLHGRAHVHLTEKVFHLVTALVDHLLEHHLGPDPALAHHLGHDGAGGRPTGQPHAAGDLPPAARRAIALTVYRDAPVVLGAGRWREFLEAFNDLARAQARDGRTATAGRPIPDLDPLFPALSAAVDHWAGAGRALSIVHDEQVSLTPERVRAAIGASSPDPLGSDPLSPDPLSPDPLSPDSHPNGALSLGGATLRLVDSQTDPRVQVADFLAGAARRIASEELNGRGDARLTALLRPYLDPDSIWGHPVSWARLAP